MKHLLFVVLIASCIGCGEEHPAPPPAVLELYGIDMSQSMTHGFVLPDTAYMRQIVETHLRAGEAYTVASYRVGDASDKPLLIASFPVAEPVDLSAAPTVRKKQKAAIDSLARANEQALTAYLQQLQQGIFAQAPHDHSTNVNEFSSKAALMLDEPGFQSPSLIKRVVLMSDCIQSSGGGSRDLLRNPFHLKPRLTICLIGCKHADAFHGVPVQQFQSMQSFLLFLQHSNSHTNENHNQ